MRRPTPRAVSRQGLVAGRERLVLRRGDRAGADGIVVHVDRNGDDRAGVHAAEEALDLAAQDGVSAVPAQDVPPVHRCTVGRSVVAARTSHAALTFWATPLR
jgi:hypothetical protein